MEKVVLSKGYEFELITNGIRSLVSGETEFSFLPRDFTAEQLVTAWTGNDSLTVKIDDASVEVIKNQTTCEYVTLIPDYLISVTYHCPECSTEVEPYATVCPNCNAAFDSPTRSENRATICKVKVKVPNINDRMTDAEDSIEDIINTILG